MHYNSSMSFSAKKSGVKILLYLILQMGHLDRPGWHSLHTMCPEEENFTQIDFLVPLYGLSWGCCRYAVKKSSFTAYITAKNIKFDLKIFVTTPVGPRLHIPTHCEKQNLLPLYEYQGLEWNRYNTNWNKAFWTWLGKMLTNRGFSNLNSICNLVFIQDTYQNSK